jgi:phage shock protein A
MEAAQRLEARVAPLDAERIQEQFDAVSKQAAVEEELARIKERLASPGGRQAAGKPGGDRS